MNSAEIQTVFLDVHQLFNGVNSTHFSVVNSTDFSGVNLTHFNDSNSTPSSGVDSTHISEFNTTDHLTGDAAGLSASVISSMVIGIVITVSIVVTNLLTIIVFACNRSLRTPQNLPLMSLALTDFLIGVFTGTLEISHNYYGTWLYGATACQLWLSVKKITFCVSMYTLCVLAGDRYRAITDPLGYAPKRTVRRLGVALLLVWTLSAIYGVIPMFGFTTYKQACRVCSFDYTGGWLWLFLVVLYVIPTVIISTCYTRIYMTLHRRLQHRSQLDQMTIDAILVQMDPDRSTNSGKPSQLITANSVSTQLKQSNSSTSTAETSTSTAASSTISSSKAATKDPEETSTLQHVNEVQRYIEDKQRILLAKERKTLLVLLCMLICMYICISPYFTMIIIKIVCPGCVQFSYRQMYILGWLVNSNSVMNHIIYISFNAEFRKAFKNQFSLKRH